MIQRKQLLACHFGGFYGNQEAAICSIPFFFFCPPVNNTWIYSYCLQQHFQFLDRFFEHKAFCEP